MLVKQHGNRGVRVSGAVTLSVKICLVLDMARSISRRSRARLDLSPRCWRIEVHKEVTNQERSPSNSYMRNGVYRVRIK